MNKNIIIGTLVVLVLLGLGYYFVRGGNEVNTTIDNTLPNTQTASQNTPSPEPSAQAAAPVVVTNQNNTTSSSTAAVWGAVNPNGASTTYWFEYGTSTALGNQSSSQTIGSGYSSISATGFITGLHANTLYYYRLSAKNKFATVNGATYTLQTNNNTPPTAVKTTVNTFAATDVARTTATLNGQVNPNGTATNYWYEYGTDNNLGSVTQFLATNSGVTFMSVPMSLTGLTPLTKYYFRLNAQNQFGTVSGTIMSFTTDGPVASSKPAVTTSPATNVSSSDATFAGQLDPNGVDTNYWFEYSTDPGLDNLIGNGTPRGTVIGTTNSQTVKINVNNLAPNTKYYYRLVGENDYGTVRGNIVSFTAKK